MNLDSLFITILIIAYKAIRVKNSPEINGPEIKATGIKIKNKEREFFTK